MKKVTKLTTATFVALSALTPVAAFAAEDTTTQAPEAGFYIEGHYYAGLTELPKSELKTLLKNVLRGKTPLVIVGTNGEIYNVTKENSILLTEAKSLEDLSEIAQDYDQYKKSTGKELSKDGGIIVPDGNVGITVSSVSAINATTLSVTLSDKSVHEVTLETALVPDVETEVTFTINEVVYKEKVTFKEDAKPVVVESVSAINATELTFNVTFNEDVTAEKLANASLTLAGPTDLTAAFVSVTGKVATFKVNEDILGKSAYNGKYTVTGTVAGVAVNKTTTYSATVTGTYVEGFVYHEVAGKQTALQGATVTVGDKKATTDARGYYQVSVNAGSYKVTIEKDGYFIDESAKNYDVVRNYSTVYNAELEVAKVQELLVAGKVADSKTGKLLDDVEVQLQKKNNDGKWENVKGARAITDGGQYVFANKSADISKFDALDGASKVKLGTNIVVPTEEYRVVLSKDVIYKDEFGVQQTRVTEVYETQNVNFDVLDNKKVTNIIAELRPIEEIENVNLDLTWNKKAAAGAEEVTVDLLAQDGKTVLVSGETIKLNKEKATDLELQEAAKLVAKDFFGAENTEPTLPTGKYFLRITDETTEKASAQEKIDAKAGNATVKVESVALTVDAGVENGAKANDLEVEVVAGGALDATYASGKLTITLVEGTQTTATAIKDEIVELETKDGIDFSKFTVSGSDVTLESNELDTRDFVFIDPNSVVELTIGETKVTIEETDEITDSVTVVRDADATDVTAEYADSTLTITLPVGDIVVADIQDAVQKVTEFASATVKAETTSPVNKFKVLAQTTSGKVAGGADAKEETEAVNISNGIAIAVLDVTEGKDVTASAEIQAAGTLTVKGAVSTITPETTAKVEPAGAIQSIDNDLELAGLVKTTVQVFKEVAGVNVLVTEEENIGFTKDANGGAELVSTPISNLEAGEYSLGFAEGYVKAKAATGEVTTNQISNALVSFTPVSKVQVNVTVKGGGAAPATLDKVELLDKDGKVIQTLENVQLDTDTVTFNNVDDGQYSVRITDGKYKPFTSKVEKVYDLQLKEFDAEIELQPSTEISGNVLFTDLSGITPGEGTVMVYSESGAVVAGKDLEDDNTYSFTGLEEGETYVFVLRGLGFETKTAVRTIEAGKNDSLNFRVVKGGNGLAQYAIVDETNAVLEASVANGIILADSYARSVATAEGDLVILDEDGNAIKIGSGQGELHVTYTGLYTGTYKGKNFVADGLSAGDYTISIPKGERTASVAQTITISGIDATAYGTIKVPLLQSGLTYTVSGNIATIEDGDVAVVVAFDKDDNVIGVAKAVDTGDKIGDYSLTLESGKTYTLKVFKSGHFVDERNVTVQEFDVTKFNFDPAKASRTNE